MTKAKEFHLNITFNARNVFWSYFSIFSAPAYFKSKVDPQFFTSEKEKGSTYFGLIFYFYNLWKVGKVGMEHWTKMGEETKH